MSGFPSLKSKFPFCLDLSLPCCRCWISVCVVLFILSFVAFCLYLLG